MRSKDLPSLLCPPPAVIPAQAGISIAARARFTRGDPRLRGDDGEAVLQMVSGGIRERPAKRQSLALPSVTDYARRLMPSMLEKKCIEKGLKMTEQRRVIARVLSDATDHPDVEALYARAAKIDGNISIATVYRTVKLFEDAHIIERHDFGDGRARYEEMSDEHHDHLIDLRSGKVLEFYSAEIEQLQERIARERGYKLVDHRLELFCIPLTDPAE